MRVIQLILALIILVVIGYTGFTFTVHEQEKAVVMQMDQFLHVVESPGLHLKLPFIQNVVHIDERLKGQLSCIEAHVMSENLQRLALECFTLWRVSDPQLFAQQYDGDEEEAEERLDALVYTQIREMAVDREFDELLQRNFSADVKEAVSDSLASSGIEIVDVRVTHAELPYENENFVIERMMAEQREIAQGIRADGDEEAQAILDECPNR